MIATNVLASAIQPLVGMLGAKEISVNFDDCVAPHIVYDSKTKKPVSLHLPVINDDIDSEALGVLRGSIDHECAHLLFTDLTNIPTNEPSIQAFFNAIEDPRIESKMRARYLGSTANLKNLTPVILNGLDKFDELYKGDSSDLASIILVLARAYWGEQDYINVVENTPLFKKFQTLLPFKQEDFTSCKSSNDAWDLAKRIYEFFAQHSDKPSKGSKKEGKDSEQSISSDKNDKPDNKNSESSQGESDNKGSKENTSSGNKGEKGKSIEDDTPQSSFNDACQDVFKSLIDKKVKKVVEEYKTKRTYSVPTYDFDSFELVSDLLKPYEGRNLTIDLKDTNQCISTLRSIFQRKLIAQSRTFWTGGFTKGRLHGSSLNKLFFNNNKIFAQKSKAQSKSVAISLIIDCSGSMNGQRIETACQTAYVLAQVLQSINIKFEILGFTTKGMLLPCNSSVLQYSRLNPLEILLFKSFEEPVNSELVKRFGYITKYGKLDQNVDGESLMIGFKRLMGRSEERKIMMVLSDGAPLCPGDHSDLRNHLYDVCRYIESKIELIGFGIDSNNVENFYTNHIVISDVKELQTFVVNKLNDILL